MASSSMPAVEGGKHHSKREETLHRSLRECTSRTLSHWFPYDVKGYHATPLSSKVSWDHQRDQLSSLSSRNGGSHLPDEVVDRPRSRSPTMSDNGIDDDDHPPANSRPSTGLSEGPPDSVAGRFSSRMSSVSPSLSDSSDVVTRRPNFPGGRNIMDNSYESSSPETTGSARELPSPVSESSFRSLASSRPSPLVSGRSLPEPLVLPNGDKRDRIGHWRSDAATHSRPGRLYVPDEGRSGFKRSITVTHRSPINLAGPLSPPPILPPIRPASNGMHPRSERIPSIVQWRVQQDAPTLHLKRAVYEDGYDSCATSTATPLTQSPYSHTSQLPGPHYIQAPQAPPPPRNKNAWKEHAVVVQGNQDQTEFRCVWRTGDSGQHTDLCGYTAKRHLVKRHIETRHLQFKDHLCPYCNKAFPQRVSLMIHVNRHTGEKPHRCRYDCDKTFSDPARRHKHMVEVHGYNPQGPRKRHRTTDSYHLNSNDFETVAPWTTETQVKPGQKNPE